MSAPTLAEGNWLARVIPSCAEPLRRVPPRCERHSSAEARCESGPPALGPDTLATNFHCRVTVLRRSGLACYRDSLLARLLLAACTSVRPRNQRARLQSLTIETSSC